MIASANIYLPSLNNVLSNTRILSFFLESIQYIGR